MNIEPNSPIVADGHFTWREYLMLRMWRVMATISEEHAQNAVFLFGELETRIRRPIAKPLHVLSGYRTPAYTKYLRSINIPAALMSAHAIAKGVDLEAPHGMSNADFWHYCDVRWPGRMENLRYTPGWVHLDTLHWGKRIRFNP